MKQKQTATNRRQVTELQKTSSPPNIKTSAKKGVLYIKKSIMLVFYKVVKKPFKV